MHFGRCCKAAAQRIAELEAELGEWPEIQREMMALREQNPVGYVNGEGLLRMCPGYTLTLSRDPDPSYKTPVFLAPGGIP